MDSINRPDRIVLALSCLLAATTVGCQSVRQPKLAKSPEPPAAKGAQTPNVPDKTRMARTDFEPKVTKRQEFGVHLSLGKNYAKEGEFDSAITELRKALEVDGSRGHRISAADRAEAHRQLAKSFDHLGKFAQSEEHYREASKLAPQDSKVWNDWGYSYHMQGRFEQAESALRTALKHEPNSAGIQNNLGLTLAAAGKTDEALELLSKAAGPASGHANLGYMLASIGRTEEAKTEYRKAVALQPKLVIGKTALARLDLPELPDLPPTATASLTPRPTRDANLQRASATQIKPAKPGLPRPSRAKTVTPKD
jgi:Flp pilus assembly protein TadD